ncbi:MAG: SGNH/GDSL hydrolase family protein [Bryobacteraceae bacterium]
MKRLYATLLLCLLVFAAPLTSQVTPPFIGMGDSIGEGVQSANASTVSQPATYLSHFARQMGAPFALPLIQSGPFGIIYSVSNRTRVDASVQGSNLSVSGADVHSILYDRAGPLIEDETDLVLSPRTGSQIEIAETIRAPFQICWIGNNDLLGAVVSNWNHLDGSQVTPLAQFTADYGEVIRRLRAWQGKVVVANLPDVTQIAWMFTPQDLVKFLGSAYGLPEGSYTTLPVMLLIKLGLNDGGILQDPSYVLAPSELAAIRQRNLEFNQVIAQTAAQAGVPVVNIAGLFQYMVANPPMIGNVPITNKFQGGFFSLDGVHPSNIGHAVIANAFIATANQAFGLSIPPMGPGALLAVAVGDPFIDWNQNLKVRGRPFTGLLETLGPFMGISGDFQEGAGSPRALMVGPKIDKAAGEAFMREYFRLKGKPPATPWTSKDAITAMSDIFRL